MHILNHLEISETLETLTNGAPPRGVHDNHPADDSWISFKVKDSTNVIINEVARIMINECDLCQTNQTTLDILAIVCSKPSNFAARHAIRSTWLSQSRQNVRSLFLVGTC